jgi:DNA mismatch endonuclease (patch repair protein)
MSRIRSKDTKPEKAVRSLLHSMGYRFRLHVKELPGKPDIILPKYKTIIFVHGCYWHRHPGCKYAYTPKSRVSFYQEKFRQNVERDEKVSSQLEEAGWTVIVLWECETKDAEVLRDRLLDCLT